MYYSKSTLGFYDEENKSRKDDAIKITDSEYKKLMEGQGQGKQIIAGKNGLPELSTPILTDEQILKLNKTKQYQLYELAKNEITWLQYSFDAGTITVEQNELLESWKKYVVLLMNLDFTSKTIEWPLSISS